MIKVIFDTNVLVSAMLYPGRVPEQALRKAESGFVVLWSSQTYAEFEEIVQRKKFDRYMPLATRLLLLTRLVQVSEFVEPTEIIRICRDPKDDKFLELAVAGQADYLITGDDDLIALYPFRDVQIISPVMFLKINELK